jgi:hypothetical protein
MLSSQGKRVIKSDARHATLGISSFLMKPLILSFPDGESGGKIVWKYIEDIQHGRRGLVSVRSAVVHDEEGNPCSTPEQLQQKGRRHIKKILVDMRELESARQHPGRSYMAEL